MFFEMNFSARNWIEWKFLLPYFLVQIQYLAMEVIGKLLEMIGRQMINLKK